MPTVTDGSGRREKWVEGRATSWRPPPRSPSPRPEDPWKDEDPWSQSPPRQPPQWCIGKGNPNPQLNVTLQAKKKSPAKSEEADIAAETPPVMEPPAGPPPSMSPPPGLQLEGVVNVEVDASSDADEPAMKRSPSPDWEKSQSPETVRKANTECKFWKRGQCRNADHCPFLHTEQHDKKKPWRPGPHRR